MSGAEPFVMPALLGAGVGLATNKKNPLEGALMGGALGAAGSAIGGPLFGAAVESPTAVASVTPELGMSEQAKMLFEQNKLFDPTDWAHGMDGVTGQQATMLAAQNQGLGMQGLLGTAASGGSAAAQGMMSGDMLGGDKMKMAMQGAQMMNSKGQGQGQPMPTMSMAPPAMKPQFNPGTFQSLAPTFNPVVGNLPYNLAIAADPRKRQSMYG